MNQTMIHPNHTRAASPLRDIAQSLATAAGVTAVLLVLLCLVYPLAVTAVGQVLTSRQAQGSLLKTADGQVIGSELLAQAFSEPRYFHPRPSAAGGGYDASASGGSNLGPTSQKLRDSVAARVARYRAVNGLDSLALVPVDAVTTSASGLDPEISPANARLQAERVAKTRGIAVSRVLDLVARHTRPRALGFLGEPGVHVLKLNRDLDGLR
jgi:potassium-transporting ATPase KdpC subunit